MSRLFGDGAVEGKPVAVVGTALGRYGGVWAHDETRKSIGIAGVRVIEDLKLSIPGKIFIGSRPRENAEVTANLHEVIEKLAAEVARPQPPQSRRRPPSAALLSGGARHGLSVPPGRQICMARHAPLCGVRHAGG